MYRMKFSESKFETNLSGKERKKKRKGFKEITSVEQILMALNN